MATLADVWSRMFAQGIERASEASADASARLRPLPNEDILFYVKRIDNSRVVRAADPAARGRCWKLIGSMGGAAILLIGVLLPSAYGLMAGYQISSLQHESQRLEVTQAALELQETNLLSPVRMQELAKEQQFTDPPPARVQYLDGPQNAMALNSK